MPLGGATHRPATGAGAHRPATSGPPADRIHERAIPMKPILAAGALALAFAFAAPAQAQFSTSVSQPHGWELGAAYGRDLRAEDSLWAVSIARTYGEGARGVLEYADGRHGDIGARVVSLKGFVRVGEWSGIELGFGAGASYLSEAKESGSGLLFALEAAYRLTHTLTARVEASRTFQLRGDVLLPANVVQAGLAWRF